MFLVQSQQYVCIDDCASNPHVVLLLPLFSIVLLLYSLFCFLCFAHRKARSIQVLCSIVGVISHSDSGICNMTYFLPLKLLVVNCWWLILPIQNDAKNLKND